MKANLMNQAFFKLEVLALRVLQFWVVDGLDLDLPGAQIRNAAVAGHVKPPFGLAA